MKYSREDSPKKRGIAKFVNHKVGRILGFDSTIDKTGKTIGPKPPTLANFIKRELAKDEFRSDLWKKNQERIEKGRQERERYITETLGAEYIGTPEGAAAINAAMNEPDPDREVVINVCKTDMTA